QAEDGIRDRNVTGVQTCALPISWSSCRLLQSGLEIAERRDAVLGVLVDPAVVDEPDRHRVEKVLLLTPGAAGDDEPRVLEDAQRSEERRVGKGCRSR